MEVERTEETLRRYIELVKFMIENPLPQSMESLHYEELNHLIKEAIKLTEELKLNEK